MLEFDGILIAFLIAPSAIVLKSVIKCLDAKGSAGVKV